MTRIKDLIGYRRPAVPQSAVIWTIGGAVLLFSCAATTILSYEFDWGRAHEKRPIVSVVALMALVAGFSVALPLHFSRGCRSIGSRVVAFILIVAALSRFALVPSQLIQESDPYRYVLDGHAVLSGINPFLMEPAGVRKDSPEHFRVQFDKPEANLILARINHPELRTIYPPLAQTAFACGVALTPWSYLGQRFVFIAFDCATIGLLMLGLSQMRKPLAWIVLYAWNPVVIKEIANSAHMDSLVALLIALLCTILALNARKPNGSLAVSAGILLGAATLAKLYPLFLAPICLGVLCRASRRLHIISLFLLSLAVTLVLGFLPFLGIGAERITESLSVYATTWQRNSGAFALVQLAFPHPRLISFAIPLVMSIVGAARILRSDQDGVGELVITSLQGALLTWFLFLPAAFPWYAVPLLALSVLRPRGWALALTFILPFYYLLFSIEYRDLDPRLYAVVSGLQHTVIWIALGAGFAWKVLFICPDQREAVPCASE